MSDNDEGGLSDVLERISVDSIGPDDAILFRFGTEKHPWTDEQIDAFVEQMDDAVPNENIVGMRGDLDVERVDIGTLRGESCPVCHTPWGRTALAKNDQE